MAYTLIYANTVEKNLQSIARYIARDNPKRAISYIDEIQQKINTLSEFPHIYQQFGRNRRLVHGNYIVLYRVNETRKQVLILSVFEGHKSFS